jgi:tRNA pseudouridine55 synthase
LRQGRSIAYATTEPGLIRAYTASNTFIGLVNADAGQLVPRRLVATQQA